MKETGLTGKRRSTTIAATPDDGNSQRKRSIEEEGGMEGFVICKRRVKIEIYISWNNKYSQDYRYTYRTVLSGHIEPWVVKCTTSVDYPVLCCNILLNAHQVA